jgi:hypothetical protein
MIVPTKLRDTGLGKTFLSRTLLGAFPLFWLVEMVHFSLRALVGEFEEHDGLHLFFRCRGSARQPSHFCFGKIFQSKVPLRETNLAKRPPAWPH